MANFFYPYIYLASASPRRAELLRQIGLDFYALLPQTPAEFAALEALEDARPNEPPRDYVARVAALKMEAAQQRFFEQGLALAPILCADTTVELEGLVLGKPSDAHAAREMLQKLAGRSHWVHTAVVLALPNLPSTAGAAIGTNSVSTSAATNAWRWKGSRLSTSRVVFGALTPAAIDAYIATKEPFGKAGSYGIQGRAAQFIERIEGSYSGVMGLPLFDVHALLRELSAARTADLSGQNGEIPSR